MKLKTFIPVIFLGVSGVTGISQITKKNGTLTVVITNLRNNSGNVCIGLYNDERGFPRSPEKSVSIIYAAISHNKSSASFENLAAGEYAVAVYHDENNNKKMDANFLGIPKEGVGASNNAKGHFGPPKFKDAKFNFSGESQTITISITYL